MLPTPSVTRLPFRIFFFLLLLLLRCTVLKSTVQEEEWGLFFGEHGKQGVDGVLLFAEKFLQLILFFAEVLYDFVDLSAKFGGVGLDGVEAVEDLVVGGDVSFDFCPVPHGFVDDGRAVNSFFFFEDIDFDDQIFGHPHADLFGFFS